MFSGVYNDAEEEKYEPGSFLYNLSGAWMKKFRPAPTVSQQLDAARGMPACEAQNLCLEGNHQEVAKQPDTTKKFMLIYGATTEFLLPMFKELSRHNHIIIADSTLLTEDDVTQPIFSGEQIGTFKVKALKKYLRNKFPRSRFSVYTGEITGPFLSMFDAAIVVNNYDTLSLLEEKCRQAFSIIFFDVIGKVMRCHRMELDKNDVMEDVEVFYGTKQLEMSTVMKEYSVVFEAIRKYEKISQNCFISSEESRQKLDLFIEEASLRSNIEIDLEEDRIKHVIAKASEQPSKSFCSFMEQIAVEASLEAFYGMSCSRNEVKFYVEEKQTLEKMKICVGSFMESKTWINIEMESTENTEVE